jgi:anti-sigma regulatory factor (Ser/Thr protein kinase)
VAERHEVGFFADPEALVRAATDFLAAGLPHGDSLLIVAAPERTGALLSALEDAGCDIGAGQAAGWLVVLDAAETLAALMVEGQPDARRFDASVGAAVRRAARDRSVVRCFGEMVGLLWERGQLVEATRLEDLWNDLLVETGSALLCGYPSRSGASAADEVAAYADVCNAHARLVDGPPRPSLASLTLQLPPLPAAATAARRFIGSALHEWGLDALADDAALVATELATNAIAHGGGPFTLGVERLDRGVVLTVADRARSAPRRSLAEGDAESGRGLHLIDALAAEWGWHHVPQGKRVWAELSVRSS